MDATIFWGKQDEDTSEEGIQAWQDLIDGELNIVQFQGGHFFCYDEEEKFSAELARVVRNAHDKFV